MFSTCLMVKRVRALWGLILQALIRTGMYRKLLSGSNEESSVRVLANLSLYSKLVCRIKGAVQQIMIAAFMYFRKKKRKRRTWE